MIVDAFRTWLGFNHVVPAAGLHVSSDRLTLAVVRPDPIRVVGLGRVSVAPTEVALGEATLISWMSQRLRGLATRLGLPDGTKTVVTVEPTAASVTFLDDGILEPQCAVGRWAHDRAARIVSGAGLEVVRFDVVPASLARLGRRTGRPNIAIRAPGGWSVVASPGFVDAERNLHRGHHGNLSVGVDLHSTRATDGFLGIEIPPALRKVVEPGHDAPAVGAALAGLGFDPLIVVEPMDGPSNMVWRGEPIENDPQEQRRNHG